MSGDNPSATKREFVRRSIADGVNFTLTTTRGSLFDVTAKLAMMIDAHPSFLVHAGWYLPWGAVWHIMRTDLTHLIDWDVTPGSVLQEFTPEQLRSEYSAINPQALWSGHVSIATTSPARVAAAVRGRALPNGWRVLEGGAR